ncbi:hypothetical protein DL767_010637 [Monosporascus sp. MG133]|nr:hypothetical protein DL767_010637 [Monosporascus sp. MG133]
MGKRKRTEVSNETAAPGPSNTKKAKAAAPRTQENGKPTSSPPLAQPVTIQIVTGSYDRILHGITATITPDEKVEFADTFLFNAHTSAIRCLALSPPSAPEPGRAQKVMLASGSSDERINVYNISAHPPSSSSKKDGAGGLNDVLSSVAPRRILENPKNREVGTLLHHSASVTRLAFPVRSKLLSAAEDSTVAVARTRDWAVLSSIRTPVPKPLGRPSGDTAALGAAPKGVNDFAVHPSMKLMITVGRGERCMRLWNLMTARKAGVLNFGRDVLRQVGEGGRGALGEGRRVVWGRADGGDDEFCVAFDRDLLVFGMDSTPKCRVMPDHRSKVHEVCYVATDSEGDASLLAVSTEDGRIMFFSTKSEDLTAAPAETSKTSLPSKDGKTDDNNNNKKAASSSSQSQSQSLPVAKFVAYLGGKEAGVTGRIKDFTVLRTAAEEGGGGERLIIPTGSSDGKVRVFSLAVDELNEAAARKGKDRDEEAKRVGRLLGTYDTSNRITCLEAFVMIPRPEGVEDSEDEDGDDGFEDVSSEDDDDDEDDE